MNNLWILDTYPIEWTVDNGGFAGLIGIKKRVEKGDKTYFLNCFLWDSIQFSVAGMNTVSIKELCKVANEDDFDFFNESGNFGLCTIADVVSAQYTDIQEGKVTHNFVYVENILSANEITLLKDVLFSGEPIDMKNLCYHLNQVSRLNT